MALKKQVQDCYAEQALRQAGLSWSVQPVSLDKIDWESSARNKARWSKPIDRDHVQDLAMSIKAGDQIPSPVLLKEGNKFIIQAGNHRCLALSECGAESVLAYVIQTKDESLLETLPGILNAPVLPVARDERVLHALEAVEKHGMKIPVAAKRFKVGQSILTQKVACQKERKVLRKLGIDHAKMTDSVVFAIKTIRNTNVLRPLANLAVMTRMPADRLREISQEIRTKGTESEQMEVVQRHWKDFERRSNNGKSETSRVLFRSGPDVFAKRCITQLEGLLNGTETINQWGITDKEDKKDFIERTGRVARKLLALCKRG